MPTLDEIQNWPVWHPHDHATAWSNPTLRSTADAHASQFGSASWEGQARDIAHSVAQIDRSTGHIHADTMTAASVIARSGATVLHAAQQSVIDAVNAAQVDGYTVSDDLSVTPPNKDKQDGAQAHAANIHAAVTNLIEQDRAVGAQIIAAGNHIKLGPPPRERDRKGGTGIDKHVKKSKEGGTGIDHKPGAKDIKDGGTGIDPPSGKGSHSSVKDAGTAIDSPNSVMPPIMPASTVPVSPMTQATPMTAAPVSAASSFGSLSSPLRSMPSPSALPSVSPPLASAISSVSGGGVNSAALTPPPPPIVSAAPVTVSAPVTPPVVPTPQQPVVPAPPPAIVQPPAAPVVQAPPPAPVPVAVQQSMMPLMPPAMMAPPPSAPLSSTSSIPITAPVTPAATASANAVIPVTPLERARQNIARMVRHMIGDLPGETRRLAAALAASTKDRPEIEWCVGGHRQADGAALFIVSNNIGLGFIPANVRLPAHTTIHVFAESENIDWAIKLGWIGQPLRAVIGYGIHTQQPVVTVAGTTTELTQYAADHPDASVHQLTPDELPDRGIIGGLNRLQIVDPAAAEKITQSLAALVEDLPIGVKPDPVRRADLWGQVLVSTDHAAAWGAFCANEAAASAWHATHTSDENTAREHVSDFYYWSWNTEQITAIAPLGV